MNLTELQKRKLMKLFSMYDATNIGVLKMQNFEALVDRLAVIRGWRSDSQSYLRLKEKMMHRWLHMRAEIKDLLGSKKDNSVTLSEWFLFYDRVLNDTTYRDHIYEMTNLIFDAVDGDDSGRLNLSEWQRLFQVYGIPVIYAQESFDSIDIDHDEQLSKEEVLQRVEEFYYSQDPSAPGNAMFGPI